MATIRQIARVLEIQDAEFAIYIYRAVGCLASPRGARLNANPIPHCSLFGKDADVTESAELADDGERPDLHRPGLGLPALETPAAAPFFVIAVKNGVGAIPARCCQLRRPKGLRLRAIDYDLAVSLEFSPVP